MLFAGSGSIAASVTYEDKVMNRNTFPKETTNSLFEFNLHRVKETFKYF